MRSANVPVLLAVMVVLVLFLALPRANAVIDFNDGGIYNIDYEIDDDVRVDWEAPGMGTTINLLAGGAITAGYDLHGYNDSRINISGGSVGHWLKAYDSTRVEISSGWITYYLCAYGSSEVTVSGGSIWDSIFVGYDSPDDSVITFAGSDFAVDGEAFGYGELSSIYGMGFWGEPSRHLTGMLASGGLLDNDFYIGGDASIVLVPEPGTVLLLGFGAVMLRRRKRS